MNPKAIDLYNEYIHGDLPRRSFLKRLVGIAGSAAAASAFLPLLESNYAWGQQVEPDDPRLVQGYVEYPGTVGKVRGYFARPAGPESVLPGVLVIHENRGLNPHIEDVARRAALAGYLAIAPDGLSFAGGTPDNQDAARDAFRKADTGTITADVIKGVSYLKSRPDCSGKVGSVGFCYGGGVALQCTLAVPASDAAVAFYGRALSADQVARVKVPLMMHYAGDDQRIDAMIPAFRTALDQNHVAYSLHMYPGTGHGFHNDTSQARYDKTASMLAWKRTMAFFDHYLHT